MTDDARPQDAEDRADGAPKPSPGDASDRKGAGEGAAPPPPVYRPSYAFLVIVALIGVAADLGTKWWAIERLDVPRPGAVRKIEVVKDHFNLIFAKNHGGAFGILGEESEAIRRPFFLLVSLAASVFIVSLFRKLEPSQRALKWGLPLVLGGALGNLVDRIRFGYVVDFIQIRFTPTFVWPTFNIADVAIVVGVGLMAIDMFAPRRPVHAPGGARQEPAKAAEEKASAGER